MALTTHSPREKKMADPVQNGMFNDDNDDNRKHKITRINPHRAIEGSKTRLTRTNETFSVLSQYPWNSTTSRQQELENLINIGFDILPTVTKSKRLKNGTKIGTIYTPSQFEPFDNVSVRLGKYDDNGRQTANCYLVDLDLETPLAQSVAFFYFKNFNVDTPTFGRISTHRNHYLFLVPVGANPNASDLHIKTKQFYSVNHDSGESRKPPELMFELKPTGHVLVPKSWHPSDGTPEQILWMSDTTEFLKISWAQILEHLGKISTICRLVEFFTEGNRNNLVFSLSSWFAKERTPFEVTHKIFSTLFDVVGTLNQDRIGFVGTISTVYAQYEVANADQRTKFGGMSGFVDKISTNSESITRIKEIAEKIRFEMFQIKAVSQVDAGDIDVNRVNQEYFLDKVGELHRYKYIKRYDRLSNSSIVQGIEITPVKHSSFGSLLNIDSKNYYVLPQSIEDKPKKMLLAGYWLQHRDSLRIDDIIFDPRMPPGFIDVPRSDKIVKYLNKWFGWAVPASMPPNADTSGFECLPEKIFPHIHDYLFRIISDGDKDKYKWLLDLLAFKLQNPSQLSEICLILYGAQHTGKSYFTDKFMVTIFGEQYSKTTGTVSELIGRFNEDYADKMMVVFHEVKAMSMRDRHLSSEILKNFITNRKISIEGKGVNRVDKNNYVQIFMTTNSYRNVPIGNDRRRYCVFKVGTGEKGNNRYFENLSEHLDGMEIRHFMYYILYLHKVNNEETYEEISPDSLRDYILEGHSHDPSERIESHFASLRQRSVKQLQHIQDTMPVSEELQSMQQDEVNVSSAEKLDATIQQCIENALIFGYFNRNKYHPDKDESINFTAADIREQFYETRYGESAKENITGKEVSRCIRATINKMFARHDKTSREANIFRTETNKEYGIPETVFRVRRANMVNKSFDQEYNKKYRCLFDGSTFITTSRNQLYKMLNRDSILFDQLDKVDSVFNNGGVEYTAEEIEELDDMEKLILAKTPSLREIGEYLYGENRWLEITAKKAF